MDTAFFARVVSGLQQDLRFAVRTLAKSQGFAAVAVMTIALGIGANSAIFSFVDGVLLKPLPYPEPDRIVRVWEKRLPDFPRINSSTLNYLDWREDNDIFEHIAGQTASRMTLSGAQEPTQVAVGRVSSTWFEVFGIPAAQGRTFEPDEEAVGNDHVVVLSHALWASRFGSDSHILGRTLMLDGEPYTVVGVMPAGSFDRGYINLWRPLAFRPDERTRDYHWLLAVARLKPGVSLDRAQRAMDIIGARIATDHPESNKGYGVFVEPFRDSVIAVPIRQSLYVLASAVGMLLLMACANLANLMLARAMARDREVSIRAALGAGRARLVRQFLTESVLLSVTGGIVGLGLGAVMMHGLIVLVPPYTLPRDVTVAMDTRVLLFTVVLSVFTGVIFGLAPALHATNPDLARAMKHGGRGATTGAGGRRTRGALVVAEVALAFMLLAGSGLLIRTFIHLQDADTGFVASNVLTASVPFPVSTSPDPARLTLYWHQLIASIDAVPGVRDAAMTSALPMQGWGYGMTYLVAGRALVARANRPVAGFKMVGPEYFQALGIRLIRGRGFTDADRSGADPVMVINRTMAQQVFASGNPLGQHILVQEIFPGRPQLGSEISWEVVGVIADEMMSGPEGKASAVMYVPLDQSPTTFASVVVRASVDPTTLTRLITGAVRAVNKEQVLSDVETLEQVKSDSMGTDRLRTTLLMVFAVFSVLLSGIGIYGVISYSVERRTHELGIRAALGASRASLLRLILKNGMGIALVGLVIGGVGATALTRLLAGLLFGVPAYDLVTMLLSTAVLLLAALLASYVPARRAARLDPLSAMRRD